MEIFNNNYLFVKFFLIANIFFLIIIKKKKKESKATHLKEVISNNRILCVLNNKAGKEKYWSKDKTQQLVENKNLKLG